MEVLSIGNSFSQDAHRYINGIARADRYNFNTLNLYIGGCTLSTHYRNMLTEKQDYLLDFNGVNTNIRYSLLDGLANRSYEVITVQQASHESPFYEKYQPVLNELVAYVRKFQPQAKIAVHQTWSYEEGFPRLATLGFNNQKEMFDKVKESYDKAAKDINADIIIPSGQALQNLLNSGIEKVHRDGFHASLGIGRYTIALTWYLMLTGNDIENNTYCYFDEDITPEEIKIAKKAAYDAVKLYK